MKKLFCLLILTSSFFVNVNHAEANEDDYFGTKKLVEKRETFTNVDGETTVIYVLRYDCVGWLGLCNGIFGA